MAGKGEKPFKITYSKEAKETIERENLGKIMEIIEDDFVTKVCESIYLQQIDELTQCKRKLTKYERAFEILKDVVIVSNLDGTYLLSVWANKLMPEPVCYLEKEQGELLEELMKGE